MQVYLDNKFIEYFRKCPKDYLSDEFDSWKQLRRFFLKGKIKLKSAEKNIEITQDELEILLKDENAPLPELKLNEEEYLLNPNSKDFKEAVFENPFQILFVNFANRISNDFGLFVANNQNCFKIWDRATFKKIPNEIRVSKKMDSTNCFKSWNTLLPYKHSLNTILVVDPYIFSAKENLKEYNLLELINVFIPDATSKIDLTIITTFPNNDLTKAKSIYGFIKKRFSSKNLRIQVFAFADDKKKAKEKYDREILSLLYATHGRFLITNYYKLSCEYGFELMGKRESGAPYIIKDTDLKFDSFFLDQNERKTTFQNTKSRLRTYRNLLTDSVNNFGSDVQFAGDDFTNRLFQFID